MQFTNLQTKNSLSPSWPPERQPSGFFDLHPIGAVLRNLLLSSLLWVLLAFALYSVYTFVAGR